MSGAMRRIGEYLGLLEDTGRYDDYTGEFDAYDEADYTRESPAVPTRAARPAAPAKVGPRWSRTWPT